MKQYKRYDKVKVRNDLIIGEEYDFGCVFTERMAKFSGKIITLDWVGITICDAYECGATWCYEMFEEEVENKYVVSLL